MFPSIVVYSGNGVWSSGNPNRPDDSEYIVRLLGQVITVSLETVKIVRGLPRRETGVRSRRAGELQC
jgi:hypothetical protein